MRPVRFAVLSSGIYWQTPGLRQAGIDPDVISYRKRLPPLAKYDVVIVPKGLPEHYLRKIGPALNRFLERQGGVVIAFGEFRGKWRKDIDWLPASGPRQIKVSQSMARMFPCPGVCMTRRADEPDGDEFPGQFENWVLAPHGEYSRIPYGATALASPESDDRNTVAFLSEFTSGGSLLAMTLDPDYHTYQGSDCAYCLLNMVIAWAKEAVEKSRQRRAVVSHAEHRWWTAVRDLVTQRPQALARDLIIGVAVGVLAHLVGIS